MTLGLLNRINHGYADLEPTIVGLMAMNRSFMLIGRHGTGKTRLARVLSQGYGEEGFVFYDATKDDLISIAGIPDPDAIKTGELRFVPHQRAIWGKSTIVVDEITRAGKESQNLWLEILEERTCFGLPLAYRTLVATANPESYAAAFQLDEALLDRFYAVLPVPEMQAGVSIADVQAMIGLAAEKELHGQETNLEAEEVARIFVQIQRAHAQLVAEGGMDRVTRYLGQLVPELLRLLQSQGGPYLSPRTYARNLPHTILAVGAYHRVAGAAEPLKRAALDSLRYGVATKLQIKPVLLEQMHRMFERSLTDQQSSETDQLRLELSGLGTFEERIEYIEKHWKRIKADLQADEIEKLVGPLLAGATAKGEKEKLVTLKHTLEKLDYKGDALRQVDGRLIITLNKAINSVNPKLSRLLARLPHGADAERAKSNIERYLAMVSKGAFLHNDSDEVRRLKVHLVDLLEGDEPMEDRALVTFFASLKLAG